jgi:hypothetical protein
MVRKKNVFSGALLEKYKFFSAPNSSLVVSSFDLLKKIHKTDKLGSRTSMISKNRPLLLSLQLHL